MATKRKGGQHEADRPNTTKGYAEPTGADSNGQTKSRNIKDAGFCWQHKEVLAFITESFSKLGNKRNQAASARSLYLALSELASDCRSETFTAATALIAYKAGVCYSTALSLLKSFELLGVVKIERHVAATGQKESSTYTLLTVTGVSVINTDRAKKDKKGRAGAGASAVRENGHDKGKGLARQRRSPSLFFFSVPKIPYPESEEQMYETLDALGIETDPDHDGCFFAQMEASGWTIRGDPVWDWPAVYEARLEVTSPEHY